MFSIKTSVIFFCLLAFLDSFPTVCWLCLNYSFNFPLERLLAIINGFCDGVCRFKCHKKCQLNAPASCGLHEERESKLVEQSNHHTTPFISPTTLTSATISNFSSRTLGGRLFDKSDPKANSLPRKGGKCIHITSTKI